MSTLTADDNMSELDTSNRGKMPPDGLLAVAAYDDDHALCVLGEFEGMNDEDDDAPSQHGGDETGVELHGRREGIRIPQLGGGGAPEGFYRVPFKGSPCPHQPCEGYVCCKGFESGIR